MRRGLKYLKESHFVKSLIQVSTGTFIAQIINFVFNIYLTRIYSPSEYGIYSYFMYIVSIILVFSTLKLDISIVTGLSEEKSDVYLRSGFIISIILGVISFIVFFLITQFTDVLKFEYDFVWSLFVLFNIIVLSGNQLMWMKLVRNKNFAVQGKLRVIESLITNILLILLCGYQSKGIASSYILSSLVIFTILVVLLNQSLTEIIFSGMRLIFDKAILKEVKKQVFSVFQSLIETVQFMIIPLFFSKDAVFIGLYSLTLRVLQVPTRVLVMPIAHVFFADINQKIRQNASLKNLFIKTVVLMIVIVIPVIFIMMFFGSDIFKILFGKSWEYSGKIGSYLVIWFGFDIVRAPLTQIFYSFHKQEEYFRWGIVLLVSQILTVWICLYFKISINNSLLIISLTQTILIIILLIRLYKIILNYDQKYSS